MDEVHNNNNDKNDDDDDNNNITVLICTANIGNAEPTCDSFESWIPNDGILDHPRGRGHPTHQDADPSTPPNDKYDIIVMGMQEAAFTDKSIGCKCDDPCVNKDTPKKEGVTKLLSRKVCQIQLTVRGLTHTASHARSAPTKALSKLMSAPLSASYDTNRLTALVEDRCPSYAVVACGRRGEMRLWVLVRRELEGEVGETHVSGENTGIGSVLANKGGIIATLTLRSTRLSFLTCHLAAHEGHTYYTNRNKNLVDILAGARPHPDYFMLDATIYSHHMFVCGDLNYRINFSEKDDGRQSSNSNGEGENDNGSHFERAMALIQEEDWEGLNRGDELGEALREKECLAGFSTLPCLFSPTFKVEREEGYVYINKRTPSYTDRILWKSTDGMNGSIDPFLYEPCPDFITSDHKPIRGGFTVRTIKGPPCPAPHHEPHHHDCKVHLLISDIKCTELPNMDNELMGDITDAYIKFISSPKALLWKKAWPTTPVIHNTLNPVWDRDFHLVLDHSSSPGGGPALLAGNMLFVTVFDHDQASGDDVIGAVALNLTDLCCNLDLSRAKYPSSVRKTLRRSSAVSSINVQKTKLSRPILKNGREFGVLECTVSAAYLDSWEVKSFLKTANVQSWGGVCGLKERLLSAIKK